MVSVIRSIGFQGLPLGLGIALKRDLEWYPGICVSNWINFAFLTYRDGRPFKFVSVSIWWYYVRYSWKEPFTTSYGLRSNFVWVDLVRSVRKTFCVGVTLESVGCQRTIWTDCWSLRLRVGVYCQRMHPLYQLYIGVSPVGLDEWRSNIGDWILRSEPFASRIFPAFYVSCTVLCNVSFSYRFLS